MTDVTFPIEIVRGVPVVRVPEELDITSAAALREALLQAATQGQMTIVDMTQTQFCDTAGIHALVLAHKRALADGRQLRLVTPGGNVLRILEITGIDRVIPRFTDLEQALMSTPVASKIRCK
jgi:anti-sigma B factor antagonist